MPVEAPIAHKGDEDFSEWTWRLQQVKESVNRLIPTDKAHIAFAFRQAAKPWKPKSFAKWPRGHLLHYSKRTIAGVRGKNGEVGIYLHPKPEGEEAVKREHVVAISPQGDVAYRKVDSARFAPVQLELYAFYYLATKAKPARGFGLAIERGGADLSKAMMDLLNTLPPSVAEVLGILPALTDWYEVLLWLDVEKEHPLLEVWAIRATALSDWKAWMPDAWFIHLDPDLRTSTEYAIGTLEKVASYALPSESDSEGILKKRVRRVSRRTRKGRLKLTLDEERLRVRVGTKWHDVTVAQMRMLSVLHQAKGHWVGGKTIGGEPHKTRRAMPQPVARIIETDKAKGYRIRPSLLT